MLRGRARLLVHNKWRELETGEWADVPGGISHALDNEFEEDALLRVRYSPGLPHMSQYFRALAHASQLGLMSSTGIPHPLLCAVLFRLSPDLVTFWWFPV